MARVFLCAPSQNLSDRYGALAFAGATLAGLGLLHLGAVLRKDGHRVALADAPAQGLEPGELLSRIRAFKPDIVGISALTSNIGAAGILAREIKKISPSIFVVAGGPHVTALPEPTLKDHPALDCLSLGEGEATLAELVGALESGASLDTVKGLAFQKEGDIHLTLPRPHISDLDSLPFPAWDLLDGFPCRFRPALFKFRRLPAAQLVTSRGCTGACVFCDTSVFGKKVRAHSAAWVLEAVNELTRKYGVREIVFEDDQFLFDPGRAGEIARGLRGKGISWTCSARANAVRDSSLLKLMRRSGCWQVNLGIESGDQDILNQAQKGTTLESVRRAVGLVKQAGMDAKGFFILGLPGETRQTMKATLDFALELPLDDAGVFFLTPFPGTRVYQDASQRGCIQGEFSAMNVLQPVFVPSGMTAGQLKKFHRRFLARFYLRPRILAQYMARTARTPAIVGSLFRGAGRRMG